MIDIERIAREAGFVVDEQAKQHQPNCIFHTHHMVDELLQRFAALVRNEVLEEASKECDRISADRWALYKGRKPYTGQELDRASDFTQGQADGADLCDQAIRALKDKK
jgi:hypothetical protein